MDAAWFLGRLLGIDEDVVEQHRHMKAAWKYGTEFEQAEATDIANEEAEQEAGDDDDDGDDGGDAEGGWEYVYTPGRGWGWALG